MYAKTQKLMRFYWECINKQKDTNIEFGMCPIEPILQFR